jgi:glycosyltransferase involved in cell wall biosynthesis
MGADFSRWAVVAHKDDTGFGRQAADVKSVLGVRRHIVIPSERLADHPLDPACDFLLPSGAPEARVEEALQGLEGIVFFERPGWHERMLPVARRLGVRSVCVPNWEWFAGRNPAWKLVDTFACVNEMGASTVRSYGFRNIVRLEWPMDLSSLPAREVAGPARLFVHNAGIIDPQDRKATRDVILAFHRVRAEGVRLLVRLQKPADLPAPDPRTTIQVGNLADHASLYADGDCMLQPSKMEGTGFMLLEPYACGLPVVTLDYPPMHELVRNPELLVRRRWFRRRAFPTTWVPHAHLRLPCLRSLARRIEWAAAHDLGPVSRANRLDALRRWDPAMLRATWSRALDPAAPP